MPELPDQPITSGALGHVTLCISDVEASRAFYVGLVGLTEIARMPQPQPGIWLQAGDIQVHLLVPPDPAELPTPRTLTAAPMAAHIAFNVPSLKPALARAEAAGINVVLSDLVEGQAFMTDPSGNIIELNAVAVTW